MLTLMTCQKPSSDLWPLETPVQSCQIWQKPSKWSPAKFLRTEYVCHGPCHCCFCFHVKKCPKSIWFINRQGLTSDFHSMDWLYHVVPTRAPPSDQGRALRFWVPAEHLAWSKRITVLWVERCPKNPMNCNELRSSQSRQEDKKPKDLKFQEVSTSQHLASCFPNVGSTLAIVAEISQLPRCDETSVWWPLSELVAGVAGAKIHRRNFP